MIIEKNLLDKVAKFIRNEKQLTQKTDLYFNVFNSLSIDRSEVKLHSLFISELLNPNGTHGLGDRFLKAFIDQLALPFEIIGVEIKVEHHIGKISEDKRNGGRIDILLTNYKNQGIVIENKIYAGEQINQLIRYNEYAKKSFKDYSIVFLTIDGKKSDYETEKLDKDMNVLKNLRAGKIEDFEYICSSYISDIYSIIQGILQHAKDRPKLYGSLLQYQEIIQQLTETEQMSQSKIDTINLLASDKDSLLAAFTISDSLAHAKDSILLTLFKLVIKNIEQASTLTSWKMTIDGQAGKKFTGITFRNTKEPISREIILGFASDYSYMYWEIRQLNHSFTNKDQTAVSILENQLDSISWGKKPDMQKGWHGEWVCYYRNFENTYLKDAEAWGLLLSDTQHAADRIVNDFMQLAQAVSTL